MMANLARTASISMMLLLTAFSGLIASEGDEQSADHKNIVFILVDDLGWADIGALNPNTFYETPNIDRLAVKGALFTHGYAASPVCSPTRAALMTGKHPTRLAATDWFHRPGYPARAERFRPAAMNHFMGLEEITMAEILRDAGYRTAFLGKWHLGNAEELWPENQGFDINIGGNNWGQPPAGFFSPYKNPRLEDGPDGEYLTERLTSEAIELLDQFSGQGQPFLMYLSYYTVHTPLEAPDATVAKYEEKGAGKRGDDDFAEEIQHHISDEPRLVRVEQNHAIYGAMIEELDRNVGRLMKRLEQTDLAEDTIIVFTSDNGGLSTAEGSPTSNLPLRGGKGWLYEGGVRVPLILVDPDTTNPGQIIAQPVISMDLLPTLLELAAVGANGIGDLDGKSVAGMLDGKVMADRQLVFHYPHYSNQGGQPGAAIRLGRYKLIENFENGQRSLYDILADPGESQDLLASKPDIVNDLRNRLHSWYNDTDARFLRPLEADGSPSPWLPLD